MFKPLVGRVALTAALFAMAACSTAQRNPDPRLSQPFPAPAQPYTGGPQYAPAPIQAQPQPQQGGLSGPRDIVLRGVAYANSGDGRFPPNSTLTVRVFDAAGGDVNDPDVEQSYTRSGVLPWPYTMGFRTEAIAGLRQPTLAAQIEGPDGQLIYRSSQAVPLVPGGSEDIPLDAVGVGATAGGNPTPVDPYTGAPIQRGPQSAYGIPDDRTTYGAPNYDAPVYSGQSYQPVGISGPPSNGVF